MRHHRPPKFWRRRPAGASTSAYGVGVDPASYTLNIVSTEGVDELIPRIQARLDAEQAPAVVIEQRPAAVRFFCETWRPILMSRVDDALDAELGPGVREQLFRALG